MTSPPDAPMTFARWVKDSVAPDLRTLGLRGSGQSYALPDDQCWLLVGLQRSTSSTAARCRFTVNLSATNKRWWSELRTWEHHWLSEKPSANAFGPAQVYRRIGALMPGGADRWWDFDTAGPAETWEALRHEVVDAIRDVGIPELRRLARTQSDRRVQRRIDGIDRRDRRPETPRPTKGS